jgi:hypothetical protein
MTQKRFMHVISDLLSTNNTFSNKLYCLDCPNLLQWLFLRSTIFAEISQLSRIELPGICSFIENEEVSYQSRSGGFVYGHDSSDGRTRNMTARPEAIIAHTEGSSRVSGICLHPPRF